VRLSFRDSSLERLYYDSTFRHPRIGTDLTRAYRKKVGLLAAASTPAELRSHKALRLEKLVGDRAGLHSIRLNDQWRVLLEFTVDDGVHSVVIVRITDYH